jgi:hypothetical protein
MLVVVDNAVGNITVQMDIQHIDLISFMYPGVRKLDHNVVLFLIFEKAPYCFLYGCINLHSQQ